MRGHARPPGIPRLRTGSLFPDDATGRCQGAAAGETCATGTSTRKMQEVAAAMGMERLSKDQVSAMCEHLDSDVFCQAEVNGNITRN